MNLKESFKKFDESILKKSPFLWIIGWHIFIPIILFLVVLGMGFSYMNPARMYEYFNTDRFAFGSVFLGFLSLIVFILFIIRQIRYNSSRVHHHLPFAKSNSNFFSYVLIIFLLSVIPLIPIEFYTFRVNSDLNTRTDNFEKDWQIFQESVRFFDQQERKRYNDYYSNSNNRYTNKLTDIEKIEAFIEVADRYDIELSETDPDVIYNRSIEDEPKVYSYLIANSDLTTVKTNTYYHSYNALFRNYDRNNDYEFHEEEVFYFYFYFSIGFAFFLWIFVSVPAIEFGLAIIWGFLISILVAFLIGLSYAISNSDGLARGIFYSAVLTIFILAFFKKRQTRFTSTMKILSQVVIPGLFLTLIYEFQEHYYNPYYQNWMKEEYWKITSFAIPIITIGSVFIYKYVYGKKTLLPKK